MLRQPLPSCHRPASRVPDRSCLSASVWSTEYSKMLLSTNSRLAVMKRLALGKLLSLATKPLARQHQSKLPLLGRVVGLVTTCQPGEALDHQGGHTGASFDRYLLNVGE